jgi:hypothetical protein
MLFFLDTDTSSTLVVLRLSADQSSGANIVFPERCITLHGDKDTVTIGRASKSTDKGFIASAGNAWFHSPVMSRLHARLSANMDDRVRYRTFPVSAAVLTSE